MKFSTRSLAFLAGGLLIGSALAPVAAQQIAPADGQVAVRSDGAVYLIANGQRRWVATVVITDDELNAYPEGEPIYAGLAPMGSQTTTASSPAAGTTSTSSTASVAASPAAAAGAGTTASAPATTAGSATAGSATAGSTSRASATPTATASTTASSAVAPDPSSDLLIDVDIDGEPKFEQGERIKVAIKTKAGASCELAVKWPDGTEVNEDNKSANSRGRCEYSIGIADNAAAGAGVLKGIVRDGGRANRMDVDFTIITKR